MAQTGSPAYAGIDPVLEMESHQLVRFPRLRGDRPPWCLVNCYGCKVPPPTRG